LVEGGRGVVWGRGGAGVRERAGGGRLGGKQKIFFFFFLLQKADHPQTDDRVRGRNQSSEVPKRFYCGSRARRRAPWLPLAQDTPHSWPHARLRKQPFETISAWSHRPHQPDPRATVPDIKNTGYQGSRKLGKEAQRQSPRHRKKMIKNLKLVEFKDQRSSLR